MAQDPMAAAAPTGDDSAPTDAGFCIEILCKPDGTFSVSVESAQEEAQEENASDGAEAGEESGQPASSIQEALKIARQLFEAGGAQDNGDSDFAAGYGSTGGSSPRGSNMDMGSTNA
jgi:hypothetical protein